MKKILLLLSIVTLFSVNTVMASSTDTKTSKRSQGGPMAVFKRTSPMPLLMSVIVKNADKLGLSDAQNAVFTQWRVENMASSLKIGNEIIAGEQAISQAALEGKPNAEIEQMISSVLAKRHTLASNMLQCRDLMVNTLDANQWEKLVTIYTKRKKV